MMKEYSVEFEYHIKEYGECTVPAESPDDAEQEADRYIREFYPDVEDVEITGVREINAER
jgi:hypothetical protein